MRPRENHNPLVAAGVVFTLAIAITFQLTLGFEPARIRSVEAADRAQARAAGNTLYAENCAACHGDQGEGKLGPALNSKAFLNATADETLVSLIRTGVPGSVMPAWGQAFGGPFTDQQAAQVVAYLRAWEPTAPDVKPVTSAPDPVRGAGVFANTCFICHGEDGQGTARAPALNDPRRLKEFDDGWYRDVIAHGRPAKGMPTWGTVLSPRQINDVVALLAAWRAGRTVTPSATLATQINSALYALRQFDRVDAAFFLSAAIPLANSAQQAEIVAVVDLVKQNHLSEAEARLLLLLPPSELGKEIFESNCASCHASDGSGGMGKNLRGSNFVKSKTDAELVTFLVAGRSGTAMNGFQGILSEEQLKYVIALMRTWR
ncbi:MAG: c-type cytochrome [Chloroflexi bacterium]|nr:c-type cytochrome [Chloroflexota bacterium]